MEKDPLQLSAVSSEPNKYVLGRPTLKNTIKFSPQPRSLISQMLTKIVPEGYKCHINNQKSNFMINHNDIFEDDTVVCENDDDKEDLTHHGINEIKFEDDNNEMTPKTNVLCKKKSVSKKLKCLHECETMEDIKCDVCFHRSNNLKEHKKHSVTYKIYSCDYPECTYYSKLSSNLTKHKRIHSSEKSFLCDQCSFRSNFINSLKTHKRLHTAEKPYACMLCSYRCNSSSNLKKHNLRRHKAVSNLNGNIQNHSAFAVPK